MKSFMFGIARRHPRLTPLEESMTPISTTELEHRFTYHPPTDPNIRVAHDTVRQWTKEYAALLNGLLPTGREAALAFTALEETAMWCHAAIARSHGHFVQDQP